MKREQNKNYCIYLDQNIYDDLVKERYSITSEQDFSIVYSTSTLGEIARMPNEYRTKFLSILKEYNSEYIWIENNLAYFKKSDPFEEFEEYLDNLNKYPGLKEMSDFAFKLHGGKLDVGFEELISNQKSAIKELLKIGLEELDEEEREKFSHVFDAIEKKGDLVFEELQNQLEEAFGDKQVINPRKELENVTGLSAQQLNNIEPPKVIENIFQTIKDKNPDLDQFNSAQDYFTWDIYNVNEDDTFGKINVIFNFLNIVGFWPDKKIDKERNFNAAMSDSQHASYAAYTNEIFTRDERFARRLNAVYEYLNIGTRIKFFSLDQINGKDG